MLLLLALTMAAVGSASGDAYRVEIVDDSPDPVLAEREWLRLNATMHRRLTPPSVNISSKYYYGNMSALRASLMATYDAKTPPADCFLRIQVKARDDSRTFHNLRDARAPHSPPRAHSSTSPRSPRSTRPRRRST